MKKLILISFILIFTPLIALCDDTNQPLTNDGIYTFFNNRMTALDNGHVVYRSKVEVIKNQPKDQIINLPVGEIERPYTRLTFFQQEYFLTESKKNQTHYEMINPVGYIQYTPKTLNSNSPGQAIFIKRNEEYTRTNFSMFRHELIAQHWDKLEIKNTEITDQNNFTVTFVPKANSNLHYNELSAAVIDGQINQLEVVNKKKEKTTYHYSSFKPIENYPYQLPHKITIKTSKKSTQGYKTNTTINIAKYDLNYGITPEDCLVQIPDDVKIIKMPLN